MKASRRSFLAGTAAIVLPRQALLAPVAPSDLLTLRSAPERVFKAEDPGKEDTESWFTHLALQAPDPGPWVSEELEVSLLSAGAVVSRSTLSGSALAALRTDLPVQGTPSFPFLLRIRGSAPRAAKVDAMVCTVKVRGTGGVERPAIEIPLAPYETKTKLLFPFRGRGLITQGGVADGGHSNRSGHFAIDAIGLSETYAPQTSDEETNEAA